MKKTIVIMAALLSISNIYAASKAISLEGGNINGYGARGNFGVYPLTHSLPFYIEAGAGMFYQSDPGVAEDARSIFINDNSGGDIEEYGTTLVLSADIGYTFVNSRSIAGSFYGGPRYSFYRANFTYEGDNEEFAVKHDTHGFGMGLRIESRISQRSSLFAKAGLDYYVPSKLYGHGKFTYNPDDKDDNPRGDYSYEDADNAVNQPTWTPVITVGISYRI